MILALLLDSAGFGEWFILLAVVLIVVGPKKLPASARKLGNYYAKFRRAAEAFKRQLMDLETEVNRVADEAENTFSEPFQVDGDEATAQPAAETAAESTPESAAGPAPATEPEAEPAPEPPKEA